MDELIKKEQLTGSLKVIAGSKYNDLVLRTLGKIYIQTGSKFTLLSDYLNVTNTATSKANNLIMVETPNDLNGDNYPGDNIFVFVKSSKNLYVTAANEYLPVLINSELDIDFAKLTEMFISKKGDYINNYLNVNGKLKANSAEFAEPVIINTTDSPLKIKSDKLVENLNALYLDGVPAENFALKKKNENIDGDWNFKGKTTFKENAFVSKGLLSAGGFSSGFSGYGWMIDSSTNTLTVDNLIVRKLMLVYELVVNKIKATNGSLWVSDSAKILGTTLIIPDVYFIPSENGIILKDDFDYLNNPVNTYNVSYWDAFYSKDYGDLLEDYPGKDENGNYLHYLNNNLGSEFSIDAAYKKYDENLNENIDVCIYKHYFNGNFYHVTLDEDYCPFRLNDLIRCLKFTGKSIKYYDAIVTRIINNNEIIIRLALNECDKFTEVEGTEDNLLYNNYVKGLYETDINGDLVYYINTVSPDNKFNPADYPEDYDTSNLNLVLNEISTISPDRVLTSPEIGDGLVRMGNTINRDRKGAIYMTSNENHGPYLDVMQDLIRPDFSVLIPVKSPDGEVVYQKPLKVRLGNLEGIYDPDFPTQPSGYGLYGENVFIKGRFVQITPSGNFPVAVFRGKWDPLLIYYVGDLVSFNGSSYNCIKETNKGIDPTNTLYWEIITSKGDDGTIGPGLSIKSELTFKYLEDFNIFLGPEMITATFEATNMIPSFVKWYVKNKNGEWIKVTEENQLFIFPTDYLMILQYGSLRGNNVWVNNLLNIKITLIDTKSGLEFYDYLDIIKLSDGASAYSVTIMSKKGDIFKPTLRNTTLKALVYHRGELQDDPECVNFGYEWERYNYEGVKDENFIPNFVLENDVAKQHSINITDKDVYQRSTFNCIITKK